MSPKSSKPPPPSNPPFPHEYTLTISSLPFSNLLDPCILRIPKSHTTVAFFSYYSHVDSTLAAQCYISHTKEGFDLHKKDLSVRIGTRVRIYVSDNDKARLILHPLEEMTWWNL